MNEDIQSEDFSSFLYLMPPLCHRPITDLLGGLRKTDHMIFAFLDDSF